jgi:nucleoside-diphosphate-sugar epimerase
MLVEQLPTFLPETKPETKIAYQGLYRPDLKNKRVFVTGATGLVGLNFIESLITDHGSQAVAAVRASSKTEPLLEIAARSQGRLQLVQTGLDDKELLCAGMKGCNAVVHAAATIDPNGNGKNLRAVNVQGTRNVLDAAIEAGVEHFVHISSLAVITGEEDKYNVTEAEPLRHCREAYANSKIDAELLVMEEIGRGRIEVTSLRPGFIYGPHEQAWMPRLMQALKKGRALVVGGGVKETNVIYVKNLSRAISLALLNSVAYGQVYNLTDGQRITKKELFDTIADELDLPRARIHVSVGFAKAICEISSFAAPWAPPVLEPLLSRYSRPAFRLAAINQGFDITKAERELGYTERIPFSAGMSETLAAWKSSSR